MTALLVGCAAKPQPAGAIRLAVSSSPESLDPRRATSAVAMRVAALVAAPLFVVGDDLQLSPVLAESIRAEPDHAWLVTLKEGARFHDGSPVRAEDVAWTFDSLRDPAAPSPHAARFDLLVRTEVVDERRVRFVLSEPFAPFPVELCAIGILSRRACAQDPAGCRDRPVGAGPYRVESASEGYEEIHLVAHEGYVDGPPGAPRLVVRTVRDGTTRLLELIDGKTDVVVGDVTPMDLRALRRWPGIRVLRRPGVGYTYLAVNLRGPDAGDDDEQALTRRALSDARVRRALAHAIDVDRIIETKLAGAAARASGLLPDGHWAKDPGLAPIPFDPDEAARLLDEAGFPDRGAGRGRFFVRLQTTTDRLRRGIALVVADRLRRVGIDVRVEVREWSTLYEDIQRGAFDLFSAKWTPVVEPDLLAWVFHGDNVPAEGKAGGNRGAYRDAEVDAWLDQARAAPDRDARAALYRRVEARLARDLPYVPLWFEDEVALVGPGVDGFAPWRSGSLLPLARARRVDGR